MIRKQESNVSSFTAEMQVMSSPGSEHVFVECHGRFCAQLINGTFGPWLFYTPHASRKFRELGSNRGTCMSLIADFFQYENPTTEEVAIMEGYAYQVHALLDAMFEGAVKMVRDRDTQWRQEIEKRDAMMMKIISERIEKKSAFRKDCGYVYLIRHSNGLVKIGFSKNPKKREKTLQAEDPRLTMIHCFTGDMSLEKRLHKALAHLRKRGEWFELEQRHVDWILFFLGEKDNTDIVSKCNETVSTTAMVSDSGPRPVNRFDFAG